MVNENVHMFVNCYRLKVGLITYVIPHAGASEEDAEYSSCTPGIQHDFKNPLYSDSTSDQYGHGQWYIALTISRLWHCFTCKLFADAVNHLPLLCTHTHTHTQIG